MPMTGVSPTNPMTNFPAWPIAVERGKCGIFSYGTLTAFANSSAKAPRPEPSTRAIFGRSLVLERINRAASCALSNSLREARADLTSAAREAACFSQRSALFELARTAAIRGLDFFALTEESLRPQNNSQE